MSEALRLASLALFVVGPVVAVLAMLRRGLTPSPTLSRIRGWRWYVPVVLLPVEWLLSPALIAFQGGEIEAGWLPVRVVGLAFGLAGAVLPVWASVLLGRLMIHEAAVRKDHALIETTGRQNSWRSAFRGSATSSTPRRVGSPPRWTGRPTIWRLRGSLAAGAKGAYPTVDQLEQRYPGLSGTDFAEAISNNILWARK